MYVAGQNPREFSYPRNSFYGYLEAAIQSTSAKTCFTLLVQEGESAKVKTDRADYWCMRMARRNSRIPKRWFDFSVDVEKIDDNGFVTLKARRFPYREAGFQEGVPIYNITA